MITKEYRKKIKTIFYYYKRLLEIPNYWSVSISPSEKFAHYAEVQFNYREKSFIIYINPNLNQDLETLKDSILHELIHIFFSPATNRFDIILQKIRTKEKLNYKTTKKKFEMWEEYLVNKVTKILIKQESYK